MECWVGQSRVATYCLLVLKNLICDTPEHHVLAQIIWYLYDLMMQTGKRLVSLSYSAISKKYTLPDAITAKGRGGP